MPVDQIEAPFYVKNTYHVITGHPHTFRLYFDTIPSYNVGGAVFDTYVDATHLTGWTLHDVIKEINDRAAVDTLNFPAMTIDKVERFEGAAGLNPFKGFDDADYSDVVGGAGSAVASATWNFTYQTAARDNYRLGWIDTGFANPQRTELPQPSATDDGGLDWFILKSPVHFTNQDGVRLTRVLAQLTGYNRYSARKYGKDLIP